MPDKIFFHFEKPVSLKNRRMLKSFLEKMAKGKRRKINNLSIVFCSDKYLLKINQLYLKHDFFTDIISFDYSGDSKEIDGELFISIDRVRENAANLGVSTFNELHRVIFHGLLHLLGYKDKKEKDRIEMRKEEDRWLSVYFNSLRN